MTYTRYRSAGAGATRRQQIADWIDTFRSFTEIFAKEIARLELGPPHQYPPPIAVRTGPAAMVRMTVRWLLKPEPVSVTVDVSDKGYEIEARGRERAVTVSVNRRPTLNRFHNDFVTALRTADLLTTFPTFGSVKDAKGNTWPRCSPNCDMRVSDTGGVQCSCPEHDPAHVWAAAP